MPRAMCLVLLVLLPAATPAGGTAAPTEDPAPIIAMIREAVRAEDTGDPDAGRFYAPVQSITDVVPPFHWHGPDARTRWMESVARDFEARDRRNGTILLADPVVARVAADRAYFVFPAAFSFEEKGLRYTREATIAVTAVRISGAWKIESWTWAGPD